MYIPASDPVLFLKLSADYNYAHVAHGRTGGVVWAKENMFQRAHALSIPAVPWGFTCPDHTVAHIQEAMHQARERGRRLHMLMIYRAPDLPITPAPATHEGNPLNDLPALEPSPLRDAWCEAGFTAQRHGGLHDRMLALANVRELDEPEPIDLARYENTSTFRPLSHSMRGSLSRALGKKYTPAQDPGAPSKIYWVQGHAKVQDILSFRRFTP